MRFQKLSEWLDWQIQLHPREIHLGLDRVSSVWKRLHPGDIPATVITVAGTNGKGSSVAMLDAILRQAGYRVGCFTSPHLLRYNERIRIDGIEAGDESICQAFERIDRARGDIFLTYFEFGTLAALDIFVSEFLDVILLEVGLGGRLDAVNIVDPDLALITSIDLDHTDWLGETRELIALEKAGIMRPGVPAVCGDPDPPQTLLDHVQEQGVPLSRIGQDFGCEQAKGGWHWWGSESALRDLPVPNLAGRVQFQNGAAVLQGLDLLKDRLPISPEAIRAGLNQVCLAGRFQLLEGPVEIILDVAHNPAGIQVLADNLRNRACSGRTLAVFAMMPNKDVVGTLDIMGPLVDDWYLGDLDSGRTMPAADLAERLGRQIAGADIHVSESLEQAFDAAMVTARPGDRVLVFGSFLNVSAVLQRLEQ